MVKRKRKVKLKTMLRLAGIQNINQKLQVQCTIVMTAMIISGWITDDCEYVAFFLITGLPELCVFFSKLCAKNPKLCANYANCAILHNIFKEKFSMFQFIKVANQA